jgi:prepilin-type N-terminal cleavage/methylation domain-containing protein/prepilin-type processing-associated H-X9-DG protein
MHRNSRRGLQGTCPPEFRWAERWRSSTAGFTLVELLVVIAIIGILMSLLMPALGSARDRAREVACLSNLRSTALGVMGYSQDHAGCMPPVVGYAASSGGPAPHSAWKHSGSGSGVDTSSRWLGDELLKGNYASLASMDCPANPGKGAVYDRSTSPWTKTGEIGPGVEFGMSGFFDHWGGAPNNTFFQTIAGSAAPSVATTGVRMARIDYPARGMLFADVAPGNRYPFIYPWGSVMMHRGGEAGNVAFFDGHALSMKSAEFWPNLQPAPMNQWRTSALWRPIAEAGVEKLW